MKRSPHPRGDLSCLAVCVIIVAAFLFSDTVLRGYLTVTADHPYVAGFCKFALLATFGESLAQRLRSGRWLPEGFGLVPRAVVWGLLGVCITLAFAIFSAGAPAAMKSLGLDWAPAALAGPMGAKKVATAFAVSLTINTMFAPAMMVAHKVADLHLEHYGGRLESLRRMPHPGALLRAVDWEAMWDIVLFRGVVFFWIPAHTVTFLLPEAFRVLFAAALGAVLGLILAWAGGRRSASAPAAAEADAG